MAENLISTEIVYNSHQEAAEAFLTKLTGLDEDRVIDDPTANSLDVGLHRVGGVVPIMERAARALVGVSNLKLPSRLFIRENDNEQKLTENEGHSEEKKSS